jgi:23S rRNA (uridine2552-2'-O)-methyltransferase
MTANYRKPDYWSLKAQKEGYPARSVYKLKEADEKFGLLKNGPVKVLDLGAAPGSWSLYVLRKTGEAVFLVAADLAPLSRRYDKGLFNAGNFFFLQGDITDDANRGVLVTKGPFDLLLSDAAPATTGNRSVDTQRSLTLAETVLSYAETALIKGGNVLVKVFQGGDTAVILKRIRELFTFGKSFKPGACRSESFETYYVGLGKRG